MTTGCGNNHHHKHNNHRYVDFETVQSAGLPVERFPETLPEGQIAEDLLAKGLEQLSLDQHEEILFEIHGIHDPTLWEEEEPERVEQKLKDLETEINRITPAAAAATPDQDCRRDAYDRAMQMNPSYVGNRNFRLQFLRSCKFDCSKAAALMAQHFEVKRQLFGDGEILAREVYQTDLDEKDQKILKSGFAQIMPERDAAGRIVALIVTSNFGNNFPEDGWEKENEVRQF